MPVIVLPLQIIFPDPWAFIAQLTPETNDVFCEYLESAFTLGDVLKNKPATLRQQVLTELAVYFDIRTCGDGQLELYFKQGA